MTTEPEAQGQDPQAGDPAELVDLEAATAILEVPTEQVRAMVEQGIITPAEEGDEPRFRRADLLAARQLGG